jgi:hypothetical protein
MGGIYNCFTVPAEIGIYFGKDADDIISKGFAISMQDFTERVDIPEQSEFVMDLDDRLMSIPLVLEAVRKYPDERDVTVLVVLPYCDCDTLTSCHPAVSMRT